MKDNLILQALQSIASFLEGENISYMVIGGIANSIYGNPRQTFDIDIKIYLGPDNTPESFIQKLIPIAKIIPHNPIQFISDTQVLPIELHGVRIDLILAGLPFEIEAINRSYYVNYLNVPIRICTIEDLIIQKAVSLRQKDWLDIATLIQTQKNNIDWKYLLQHCQELSDFLDRKDIFRKIKQFKDEA